MPSESVSNSWAYEILRYYFDEHIKGPIARGLQSRGVDVLTAQEAGMADRALSDLYQLQYAASLNRVLVTEDRDFVRLAYALTPHAGVILLQRLLSIGESIEYLELMAQVTEPEEIHDQLVYCDW